jgi:hypothetical protein
MEARILMKKHSGWAIVNKYSDEVMLRYCDGSYVIYTTRQEARNDRVGRDEKVVKVTISETPTYDQSE